MRALCGGGHGTNLSQLVSSHPHLIILPTISVAAERNLRAVMKGFQADPEFCVNLMRYLKTVWVGSVVIRSDLLPKICCSRALYSQAAELPNFMQ